MAGLLASRFLLEPDTFPENSSGTYSGHNRFTVAGSAAAKGPLMGKPFLHSLLILKALSPYMRNHKV